MKVQYPALASIDSTDWAVAEDKLKTWLHGAVSSRWESKHAHKYVGSDGKPKAPAPPMTGSHKRGEGGQSMVGGVQSELLCSLVRV